MSNNKCVLRLEDVHKTFSGGKEAVHALRGVDLEVPRGEVFGFLGPNGAGKTTTLRVVTTLLPFDKGEVAVAGVDVKVDPQAVRKVIGYVSQVGGSDASATGRENLMLQGRLYGLSREACLKQMAYLVKTFTLEECVDRVVSTYSGGQKRRLDIALAMMHRPQILFLDEPTNALDPQSRDNLWKQILELKKQGITIFLTSHYLDEVDALADSLAIMDHGRVVAAGTLGVLKAQISGDIITLGVKNEFHPRALALFEKKHPAVREVKVEESSFRLHVDKGSSVLPEILRMMDQANIHFESVQVAVPSLNDVFLQKTGRHLRDGEAP